jgi:hypothetical protein
MNTCIAQSPILPQLQNLTIIIASFTIFFIMHNKTESGNSHISKWLITLILGTMVLLSSGCMPESAMPTAAVAAPTVDAIVSVGEISMTSTQPPVPPTWTPQSQSDGSESVSEGTFVPTSTQRPTKTPFATLLPTLTLTSSPTPIVTSEPVTDTPVPPPTDNAPPPIPPNPVYGENLLPNSSFEEGHYNMWGIPELQLPVGWTFEWDENRTGFGNEVWDVYVRPEIRVMSTDFLPASEHSLFIYDGKHTIKAFKQNGAISFKLFREVYLEPGTYVLEINVYPDLYMDYQEGVKIWADDPLTGQVRFIAPQATGWMGTQYGRKNTLTHMFTVDTPGNVPIGAAMRGNHAIMNDGWFFDDWLLRRIEN